jgi:hypothetical protein
MLDGSDMSSGSHCRDTLDAGFIGGEGFTAAGFRAHANILRGSTGGSVDSRRTMARPTPRDAPVTMTVVGDMDILRMILPRHSMKLGFADTLQELYVLGISFLQHDTTLFDRY